MTDELGALLRAEVSDVALPPGIAGAVLAAHTRDVRRRRTALAGAALTVAAASVGAFVLLPGGDGNPDDRLAPFARPDDPVIRDGDRVTATGMVVQVPGAPPRLCAPVPMPAIARGPEVQLCERGVDLEGVNLQQLGGQREHEGAVEGSATITGTFRPQGTGTASGTVVVERQELPPVQPTQSEFRADTPPCPAPEGGWPRDP